MSERERLPTAAGFRSDGRKRRSPTEAGASREDTPAAEARLRETEVRRTSDRDRTASAGAARLAPAERRAHLGIARSLEPIETVRALEDGYGQPQPRG